MSASAKIFLSTVSDEFRAYRDQLRSDLTRPNVEVKVQEDFKDQGRDTLDELDVYIAGCDAVVHLAGDMTGSAPAEPALRALRAKYRDLADKLPPLGEALQSGAGVSYTQWEAWLALYHGKLLVHRQGSRDRRTRPKPQADRRLARRPGDASGAPQSDGPLSRLHLHQPGQSRQAHIVLRHSRSVGEGASRRLRRGGGARSRRRRGLHQRNGAKVAGDKALDFDGKKQAVRNAIEIYETEIAGRPSETNFDAIVDAALAKARTQVDKGQSALARATLDKAAEDDGARGGGAPRTLRRGRDRAPQSRTRHRACDLRRRRRGGRHSEAGALDSRGERGDGRGVPQYGSAGALRIRPRSRKQCASRRCDRAAARTVGARVVG